MLGPATVTKYNGKKETSVGLEVIPSGPPNINTKHSPQANRNVTK
jgi:hypothetical protein